MICIAQRSRIVIRRGFSLIEAMGLMMVLGMVMVLVGTTIHRVSLTQKMTLGCVRYSKTLEDLRYRLCMDTKNAQQLEVQASGVRLMATEGRTIEYSVDAGFIVRNAKSNEGVVIGQNRWRVGAQRLTADLDSSGAIPLATFQLNIDRQLSSIFGATGQGSPTVDNSNGMETVRWVSRLGREAR